MSRSSDIQSVSVMLASVQPSAHSAPQLHPGCDLPTVGRGIFASWPPCDSWKALKAALLQTGCDCWGLVPKSGARRHQRGSTTTRSRELLSASPSSVFTGHHELLKAQELVCSLHKVLPHSGITVRSLQLAPSSGQGLGTSEVPIERLGIVTP